MPMPRPVIIHQSDLGRDFGTDECVLWGGAVQSSGYGNTGEGLAHRVAFKRAFGEPEGQVDHTCHNEDPDCLGGHCEHRLCINLRHLRDVTPSENQRAAAEQRMGDTCKRGHPRTPENTYVKQRTNGQSRECRECMKVRA